MVGYQFYSKDPADEELAKLGKANQALARAMALPLVWGHQVDPTTSDNTELDVETNGRTTLYGAFLQRKICTYCETTGTGGKPPPTPVRVVGWHVRSPFWARFPTPPPPTPSRLRVVCMVCRVSCVLRPRCLRVETPAAGCCRSRNACVAPPSCSPVRGHCLWCVYLRALPCAGTACGVSRWSCHRDAGRRFQPVLWRPDAGAGPL